MHLGIDGREIENGVYTGIGRALANFLQYFSGLKNEDTCVVFSTRKLPIALGPKISNVVVTRLPTLVWDQVALALAIKKEHIDLFYSPYYKVPIAAPCPVVNAVLDLMYLSFPAYRRSMPIWSKLYYLTFGSACLRKSRRILTCSQFSKQDIMRIYRIDERQIDVVPLSVAPIYRPEKDQARITAVKKQLGINGRYFLSMGNFKPHKNVQNIIRAFACSVAVDYKDVVLVLAGPKEHGYAELKQLVKDYRMDKRVIFPGKISEKDLPHALYSGAEALVMPTLYEGFGLPVVEAMACGTPVIASDTTSLPEVAGNAAMLVDPHDVIAIGNGMRTILEHDAVRADLKAKGLARVAMFDPMRIERLTYDFLLRGLNTV